MFDGLPNLDGLPDHGVLGQVDNVVPCEQPVVDQLPYAGDFCKCSGAKAAWKSALDQIDDPDRTSHSESEYSPT